MARKLIVEVVGDTKSLEAAFSRSSRAAKTFGNTSTTSLSKFDSAFTKTQRLMAGGFLGGAAATAGIAAIQKSVAAASDLNEQLAKNQQVFGESAASVQAWSETTAEALGVSQQAALEATGTFGNLFASLGTGGPKAAEMSKQLVRLAADLASFNNADPSEVLAALRSGLVGEAEPLRRFGVLLSEARVQQEALNQTGKRSVDALTNQEKAAARVAIIFRDTAKAQGDFERTSGSLANQQRVLAANVADLQANLGTLLLPAMTSLTEAMVAATDNARDLIGVLTTLGKIKIPPIEVPILETKIPGTGSRVGKLLGKAISLGLKGEAAVVFGPFGQALLLRSLLAGKESGDAFSRGFADAIRNSPFTFQLPQPKAAKGGPKGFGSGLTPMDLYGPIIKQIPIALQEALLDAERAGNPQKIIDVLLKQRDVLLKAMDDPRLKAKGRVEIKGVLAGVDAAIEAQRAAIRSSSEQAAQDARAAAEKVIEAQRKAAEKIAKEREKAAKLLQASQFRALGLSGSGNERIPGVENLRKQLSQLSERLAGSDIQSKLVNRLAGVRKLLSGQFGKLTEETRSAINDLFAAIRGEFDEETRKGPLTKTTSLNTNKLLEGLGLGRDMEKELRARLSSFNSAGMALAGAAGPTGGFRGGVAATPIQTTVVVELDGQVVGRNTTRYQQKAGRRNPRQKRGPNSGV